MLASSNPELAERYSSYRKEFPLMVANQNEWLQGK
jgi:CRISPR/Cas system CMR-associated protein Cmr5 small subunit